MTAVTGILCPGIGAAPRGALVTAMRRAAGTPASAVRSAAAGDAVAPLFHDGGLTLAGAAPATGKGVLALDGEILSWGGAPAPDGAPAAPEAALLAAITAAGDSAAVGAALRQARGAYAGAAWDGGRLRLFRAPFCGTSLFYAVTTLPADSGVMAPALVFTTRLTALRALPGFAAAPLDPAAVGELLARGCCHHCILQGVRKLPPGGLLTVGADDLPRPPAAEPWWSPARAARGVTLFPGTDAEAVEELEALLRTVLREYRPAAGAGILLSGGVDAATLAALTVAAGETPATYTIGFADAAYDESAAAARIAGALRTVHHERRLTDGEVLDTVARLSRVYDEPFADSSQIPVLHALRLAGTEHAAVVVGDGGDENFGGYERYRACGDFWTRCRKLPPALRRAFARVAGAVPPACGNAIGRLFPAPYPRRWGDKARRLARAAGATDFAEFYARLTENAEGFRTAADAQDGTAERFRAALAEAGDFSMDDAQRAMLLDLTAYIPDDTGPKTAAAAAALGMTARAPLLDLRVVEFALSLPPAMKIRRGADGAGGKWILRQVAGRHLPDGIAGGPKKGFGAPLASWLRGPLREWAAAALAPDRLSRIPWLDPDAVARLWTEHRNGRDHAAALWNVLMLLAWEKAWTAGD